MVSWCVALVVVVLVGEGFGETHDGDFLPHSLSQGLPLAGAPGSFEPVFPTSNQQQQQQDRRRSKPSPAPPAPPTSERRKRQESSSKPKLVDSKVFPIQTTVTNEYYEFVLAFLEFDQDIYGNDPLVCAGSDYPCVASDCVPCDWTGPERTDCDNPNCCGPAQFAPLYPATTRIQDWCDTSLPSFTKLNFDEPTARFTLSEGEYEYFRLFIGEEEHCRTITVIVYADYGQSSLEINNFLAYPNQTNLLEIENDQLFGASRLYTKSTATYGHTVLSICPNVNPAYERGTYSLSVQSLSVKTQFYVVAHLADEVQPMAPPDDRVLCSSVPDEEYRGTQYFTSVLDGGHYCLEEGITTEFYVFPPFLYDMVLPVKPGCHEISLTFNGFTGQEMFGPDGDITFYAFQSSDSRDSRTASVIRNRIKDDEFYFNGCFDEVTYVHFDAHVQAEGTGMFYWTTESKPLRWKPSEVSTGMLSSVLGQGKAMMLAPGQFYEGSWTWGGLGLDWITQPTTDPLVFWPPYDPPNVFDYSGALPPDVYVEAGLSEIKDNMIVMAGLTIRKNNLLRSLPDLIENGFITSLGFTNEDGVGVELCSDEEADRGTCQQGSKLVEINSWTDFLPTISFSSLNVYEDPGRFCSQKLYEKELALVQKETEQGLQSNEIGVVARSTYLADLYNTGVARQSCIYAVAAALESTFENVTKVERNYCPFEFESAEFEADVCCNTRLESIQCCALKTVDLESDVFTSVDEDDLSKCGNPDCDESFFADIATSLNSRGNPLISCDSGLGDAVYEADVSIETELEAFFRPCLDVAGYGRKFLGISCTHDEDCEIMESTCNLETNTCYLHDTEETKNRFFSCYLETMSSSLEEYIRRNVLPSIAKDYPRGSEKFNEAVKLQALVTDCINPKEPLDFSLGEHWEADSVLYCKGSGLDSSRTLSEIQANEESVNGFCPKRLCLGEKACRYEDIRRCQQTFDHCLAAHHTYNPPSSLSSCPEEEVECNVEGVDPEDCNENRCVLCLGEGPCMVVDGVDDEDDCNDLVGCVMPDGSVRYDLTEDECEDENTGACTVDCDGESCRSLLSLSGVCELEGADEDTCESAGGFMKDGDCLLPDVTNEYDCDQTAASLSSSTEWHTCSSVPLSSCGNHSTFTPAELYLRCYHDTEFGTCDTKAECEAAGACSDAETTRTYGSISEEEGFEVSYGVCVSSGLGGFSSNGEPFCYTPAGERIFLQACLNPSTIEVVCAVWNSSDFAVAPYWSSWLEPAKTQEDCQQNIYGRYGCAIPNGLERSNWFWNETECECLKGQSGYIFSWEDGVWQTGKAHSLQWLESETYPKYQHTPTISLYKLESWLAAAAENTFLNTLKSQLVCQTNYLTSSLSTLVCDCFGEENTGSECFPDQIETFVGLSSACAGVTTTLKGPSSFIIFHPDGISSLCTETTLHLIQKSWFLFPKSPPAVNFQFAEIPEPGIVVNRNGATVGEVVGDGSRIDFGRPELVETYEVCLLISDSSTNSHYPNRDFGEASSDLHSIYPLGLKDLEPRVVDSQEYWCAFVRGSRDMSVSFFPVLVEDDYEDKDEDTLSHQTTSFLYTLGALYCFDFLLCFLYLGVSLKNGGVAGLPPIALLGVIFGVTCIFRIVFCFLYANEKFEDDSLAEYVVFEIPTFLLLSGLIYVIYLFLKIVSNKDNFFHDSKSHLVLGTFIALFLVWSLFIIVTIIYSEKILDQEDDAVCPGRVQASNDEQEEDARTLAIIYQSIVIAMTFILTCVFAKAAHALFSLSKGSVTHTRFIFRIGTVIAFAFTTRCILFLVLLAIDLTSDIYLFITLLLTEVLMILLIQLELNQRFYNGLYSSAKSAYASKTPSSGSNVTQSAAPRGASRRSDPYEMSS